MQLDHLLPELHVRAELEIQSVASDSRRVKKGALFFAFRGTFDDGNRYVEDAVRRGAVAIISDREHPNCSIPHWAHPEARALFSRAAFRGMKERAPRCVGITGTNGKTTTSFLLRGLLGEEKTALVGTCGNFLGEASEQSGMTTPGPLEIAGLLGRASAANMDTCVLEVSSHALDQRRVDGLDFPVAIFTNLSGDHLDYHGTEESYLAAKTRLFSSQEPGQLAVLNADDPASRLIAARAGGSCFFYSTRTAADARAESLEYRALSTRFDLRLPRSPALPVEFPMPGRHNVENALAAALAAHLLGVEAKKIARRIQSPPSIPGRCESLQSIPGVEVVVDYAHTDEGLERILTALRHDLRGRLIVVFGAGGERDRSKRPRMGRVADRLADLSIVTSDNPRRESPAEIAEEICRGFRSRPRINLDRRMAIREALFESRPGDRVLVAGKGHEKIQVLGTRSLPFDDRDVVLEESQRVVSSREAARSNNPRRVLA